MAWKPTRTKPLILTPPHGANVPHEVVRHSPTGFSWGYGGSGPADLALNTLVAFGVDEALLARSPAIYMDFKWQVIAKLHGGKGHVVSAEFINDWIAKRLGQ